MARLFWASVAGNVLLALSAYFLFSTNSALQKTSGEQVATIDGYRKTTVQYKDQVARCVETQKSLILDHRRQITHYQQIALKQIEFNKTRIDRLLSERGRLEAVLRGIRPAEVNTDPERRIAEIDRMVDAYIVELQK